MELIESFEKGLVSDFGMPEKVVETAISKLFFFPSRVIKVYKRGEYFFANLSNKESRKKFFEDDFFWNHAFAPKTYLRLVEHEGDFYIEMKRIEDLTTLTTLLQEQFVTPQDMRRMTRALIERLHILTTEHPDKLADQMSKPFSTLMQENLDDLRQWLYMGAPHIQKSKADTIVDMLQNIVATEAYFTKATLCAAIDNNSDNLLFLEGFPSFIDIMTPKENWRVLDEYGTVARTAVDAYVLGNKELGDAVYEAYRESANPIPNRAATLHEIRAACIQWSYRHLLGQHDVAEKFKTFILQKMEELK